MLFKNGQYLQAMHCYEHANLHRERDAAEAHYLRDRARKMPADSRSGEAARANAYAHAAAAFLKSGRQALHDRRPFFRRAAECYVKAEEFAQAAQAYLLSEEYTLSANLYRKVGLFDDAVAVIKAHGETMDQHTVQTITDVSRLEYLRKHNFK